MPDDDIAAGIARIRRTLQIRDDHNRRGDKLKPVKPVRFDWKGCGRAVRAALAECGLRDRDVAAQLGVTATALSKLASGGNVDIAVVIEVCRWAGLDLFQFHHAPANSTACTLGHVKHSDVSQVEERS